MRAVLAALALGLGCRGATYALPARAPAEPLRAATAVSVEEGSSLEAIRAMETSCRQGLRAETVRASLATMDRVRLALGSVCGLEYVGGDPLHWRLHCGTDDFFGVGQYALNAGADRNGVATTAPCEALGRLVPSLRTVPVHRWVCAGAVLHELVAGAARAQGAVAPSGRIELAVLGHSDTVNFREGGSFDACPSLRATLAFTPPSAWSSLDPRADVEARRRANEQLSWCRAAEVARSMRCGLALVTHGNQRFEGDPCAALRPEELGGTGSASMTSVVGAGSTWIETQPTTTCSAQPGAVPGSCPEARRVDVFVRFVPSPDLIDAPCPHPNTDPAGALACLQQCLERAAAPSRELRASGGGRVATSDRVDALGGTDLHQRCGTGDAYPASWIRYPALTPGDDCRELNVRAVRGALRMR